MITIKHKDYTFLAVSINIHDEGEGKATLWASKVDGYNMIIYKGTLEDAKEYRKAIEWAIGEGKKIFEM